MSKMKESNTRVIAENMDMCILWVSGMVTSIDQVVQWVGGFLVPKHDDSAMFTMMQCVPAGNDDGDIIVFLTDKPVDPHSYWDVVEDELREWNIPFV